MGLKKGKSDVTYVKFKEGLFYSSKDAETGYDEFEGFITNFNIVDEEYNKNVIRKLVLKITDDEGENYVLKIGFESAYATDLIAFLKNADLSKKLSLVGKTETTDGKTKNSILVKQDGTFLKKFYTKANPNGLPKMVQKKNGKWDKDDMMEFLEDVVLNEFNSRVATEVPEKVAKVEVEDDEEGSDLPF